MAGHGAPRGENQGGGPKTPEGRDRALANLHPDPRAATVHGAHTFLTRSICPPCRLCVARGDCEGFRPGDATCQLAEAYQADTAAAIMDLPQIQVEDRPLVLEFSKVATALSIIDRYIAHASPLLPGTDDGVLEAQPVMKTRASLSNQLVKLADVLGLSPAARMKLKSGKDPVGSAWARAVIEADFTPEPAEK